MQPADVQARHRQEGALLRMRDLLLVVTPAARGDVEVLGAPATVDPAFLDSLAANPNQVFPVKLGTSTFNVSLKDIIYDAPKGNFPHPNTMTCKLMGGDQVLLEQEYYSVGGGFIEWKGYTPPKKGAPKYPYQTIKEVIDHCNRDKISIVAVRDEQRSRCLQQIQRVLESSPS